MCMCHYAMARLSYSMLGINRLSRVGMGVFFKLIYVLVIVTTLLLWIN